MKPLLLAAAVCLLAPAAHAQVAAGSLPNTFDGPRGQTVSAPAAAPTAPQAAPPAAPVSDEPANAASEETLRTIIAEIQAGELDYDRMTDDLAVQVREQEAQVTPLVQGYGSLVSAVFIGSQAGLDHFNVIFANSATLWRIGVSPDGEVSALQFREVD